MPTWYLGKIRIQEEQENGGFKAKNEAYLVDSVSYSDAEAKLYRIGEELHRNFEVLSIGKIRLADIFNFEGGDRWFKCKVVYITEDEKGREKKIVNYMLTNAENPKEAYERVESSLSTMLIPIDITDVTLTPILEVFPYSNEDNELPPANFKPLSEVVTA